MAKTTKKKTRRSKKKAPGLFAKMMSSTAGFVGRHPSWVAGPLVFGVVFSFVSANALWYQPGPHPGAFMKTRLRSDPYAVPGQRPATAENNYNTFVIEREGDGSVASQSQSGGERSVASASPESQPTDLMSILETVQTAEPVQAAEPLQNPVAQTQVEAADSADILASVQKALAERGYYQGKPDGLSGPLTTAAIKKFQTDHALAVTGEADQGMLAVLNSSASAAPPLPQPRSATADVVVSADPVASLLSAESSGTQTIAVDPMIVKIQRGLVNIAYDDVTVDGVAGSKTREAILEFQKHYRLPQTGEPSVAVLDKLEEIGAL